MTDNNSDSIGAQADEDFDRLMDAHQTLIRLKPGDVLTQEMIDDLLLVESDYRENDERNTDAFHKGYEVGLERGSNADVAKLIEERDQARADLRIAKAIAAVQSAPNQVGGITMTELKGNKKLPLPMTEHPTDAMWSGLARDIMMWLDFDNKTPRALFQHLKRLGRDIPDWLRDEPEMKALDHVPSKGTRCVLIYKAMEAAKPSTPSSGCVWLDLERPCQTEGCTICRPSTPIDDEGLVALIEKVARAVEPDEWQRFDNHVAEFTANYPSREEQYRAFIFGGAYGYIFERSLKYARAAIAALKASLPTPAIDDEGLGPIESIARLICEAKGYDPDMPTGERAVQWQSFMELAKTTHISWVTGSNVS